MVKYGCVLLGHRILKSAIPQLKNLAELLHANTNLRKLEVTLIVTGWAWSNMGVCF